MLAPETILQDRYRVVRPLGRGGMGAVYEAVDKRLSRTVALKETLGETAALRRAFEREAHLLANLRHPALPNVIDHFDEGTGLFLVMEFIPGDDLGAALETNNRPFPADEVLRWADQLLDALEYLHTHEPPVLHRDIKPANLKLAARGQIILLDFGLAKGTTGEMAQTAGRSVLGYTPSYSSLEQIQGTGTDPRSDLYSLGATLYHLLTAAKPPDALARATAVVNGQPDPLVPAHEVNRQVTVATSHVITRAMSLNLDQRPRTAADMRHQLRSSASRVSATVPVKADKGDDETTRISLPAMTAATAQGGAPLDMQMDTRRAQRPSQVVVPVPVQEETRVTQRPGGGAWKWVLAGGFFFVTASLLALYYFFGMSGDRTERARADRTAASPSPTPSATPTPTVTPSPTPGPTPTESSLLARERLAQRNIPFSEEAFIGYADMGDAPVVETFLAAGMDPDSQDGAGRTALASAALKGHNRVTENLLAGGADVNAKSGKGLTPLMGAAANSRRDTMKVLLGRGADVNLRDENGQTALLIAAARGHNEAVRLLINSGAGVNVKDNSGRSALAWAEINNHSDVAELLRKAGATGR